MPIFIGTLVLFLFRWRINILSLGDEEAKALGTDVEKKRAWLSLFVRLL
nr:iron chelate uptake ABC transporter family permease subunit [Methanosarcina barkeri]